MRPEVVPAPLVEAPHPYGTGLAIRKEANGLYSLHSSASWPRDSLEEVNALRTFVDSLGNEHATDMRIRQCYGSILLEFYDVRCDYSPETGWTNQDAYSNALDEATQQIVIPFPDTGATLTLNLSDITIATSERFSLTSGDTLPWKFPQMIVEEGTYMIERILECELGERLGRSTLTVERNEDGSFTERLSGGTLGFDIEFCFDEEGRISGYTFLRNASSTDDPSVGIQQSGSFVKDVHFVGSSTGTDFGTYDFDFSSFQIVNRTGSDLVINGNTIKPEASSGEAESTSAASGTSPLEAFSAMVSPSSLSIDENGVLKRLRSDGDWKPVYLLACGQFAATDAAEERNGVYYATPASGALKIGASGRDGMGTITAGALERSTTDLAHELSEMIRAQHAYAANTKVLSTIDDMLTELERL
jgi:flagellar hook protein FlgE